MTDESFRKAALAALINARSLLYDAHLLFQHKSPRSIALSVIGIEELGKAILLAIASLDALTAFRQRLIGRLYKHEVKQFLEVVGASSAREITEDGSVIANSLKEPARPNNQWVGKWLAHILTTKNIHHFIFSNLLNRKPSLYVGSPSQVKERAMYIELDPSSGSLVTPLGLGAGYNIWLRHLEDSLSALAPLENALLTSTGWKEAVCFARLELQDDVIERWNSG